MESSGESELRPVLQMERTGISGQIRLGVATLLGVMLMVAALVAYAITFGGRDTSLIEVMVLLIAAIILFLLPCLFSQITRCRLEISDAGVREHITSLLPFLPLGLKRTHVVRWQDIRSLGLRRLRGGRQSGRAQPVARQYLVATIEGQPPIKLARRYTTDDPEFDGFFAEFKRRLEA